MHIIRPSSFRGNNTTTREDCCVDKHSPRTPLGIIDKAIVNISSEYNESSHFNFDILEGDNIYYQVHCKQVSTQPEVSVTLFISHKLDYAEEWIRIVQALNNEKSYSCTFKKDSTTISILCSNDKFIISSNSINYKDISTFFEFVITLNAENRMKIASNILQKITSIKPSKL